MLYHRRVLRDIKNPTAIEKCCKLTINLNYFNHEFKYKKLPDTKDIIFNIKGYLIHWCKTLLTHGEIWGLFIPP